MFVQLQGGANVFPQTMKVPHLNQEYQLKNLVAETKISFFLWLSALDVDEDRLRELWAHFDFYTSNNCGEDGIKKLSAIRIPPPKEASQFGFVPPSMSCDVFNSKRRCYMNYESGIGYPGRVSKWFNKTQLHHFDYGDFAYSVLSPFVRWNSLLNGIDAHPDVSSSDKLLFKEAYNIILNQINSDFESVQNISIVLNRIKIIGIADENKDFSRESSAFLKSSDLTLNKEITPEEVAFVVLLHEIGHQFSFDHADEPGENSIVFSLNENNSSEAGLVTKESAMAYGDRYYYLQKDDVLGMNYLHSIIKDKIAQF